MTSEKRAVNSRRRWSGDALPALMARSRKSHSAAQTPLRASGSVTFFSNSPCMKSYRMNMATPSAAARVTEAPHKIGGDGELEWFGWFFDQGFMSLDEEMRQMETFAKHIIPAFH